MSDREMSDDDRGNRSDEAEEEPSARPASGDDEAKETTGRRIDPSTSTKKISRAPQPKLDAQRIQGPKGVHTLEKYFDGFKFHGKGHEKNDLDRVMKRMEHWAHRLFPKYQFDDFLTKMEMLGNKKNVQVFLKKYRMGMIDADEDIIKDDEQDEVERGEELIPEESPIDEFDKLIAEQIEKQRKVESEKMSQTKTRNENSTMSDGNILGSAKTMKPTELSDEIKARIEANRKIALERKMAREKRMEMEKQKQNLDESTSEIPSQHLITKSQDYDEVSINHEKDTTDVESFVENTSVPEAPADTSQIFEDLTNNLEKSRENIEPQRDDSKEKEIFNEGPENIEKDSKSPISSPQLEEAMEISTIEKSIEAIPDETENIDLTSPISQKKVEKPKVVSNRLLTRDELLMEIDGVVEEIIKRNERRST